MILGASQQTKDIVARKEAGQQTMIATVVFSFLRDLCLGCICIHAYRRHDAEQGMCMKNKEIVYPADAHTFAQISKRTCIQMHALTSPSTINKLFYAQLCQYGQTLQSSTLK
jgi:hypothetical protein